MAQLSDSAAQCAVDAREFIIECGSELPIPVFDKGRLLYERLADIAVLSVTVASVGILSNECGLDLRHDGRDVRSNADEDEDDDTIKAIQLVVVGTSS